MFHQFRHTLTLSSRHSERTPRSLAHSADQLSQESNTSIRLDPSSLTHRVEEHKPKKPAFTRDNNGKCQWNRIPKSSSRPLCAMHSQPLRSACRPLTEKAVIAVDPDQPTPQTTARCAVPPTTKTYTYQPFQASSMSLTKRQMTAECPQLCALVFNQLAGLAGRTTSSNGTQSSKQSTNTLAASPIVRAHNHQRVNEIPILAFKTQTPTGQ